MRIGDNIKKAIKLKGITQAKLAEELDLSAGYVSDVINGKKNPSLSTMRNMAMHLSTPLSNLLKDVEESYFEDKTNDLELDIQELKYWKQQAQKIEALIYVEEPSIFAQVEDIYIEKFNKVKEALYRQNDWSPPNSNSYCYPSPDKLGGVLERVHTFYDTKPCGTLESEGRSGYRIKLLREQKGISQVELARKLGIHPEIVWRWENLREAIEPLEEYLPKVAKVMGVSVGDLFGKNSSSKKNEAKQIIDEMGEAELDSFFKFILSLRLSSQMQRNF